MHRVTDAAHRVSAATAILRGLRRQGSASGTRSGVRRRSFYGHFTDAAGSTGRFHVYARHIDPNRTVGVVFYLDGDYWLPARSRFHRPQGLTMLRLAAVANSRNFILVSADTPDRSFGRQGYTWWVRAAHNGLWFRAFAAHVMRRLWLDPERAWVMGYSGGAEFIAFDLLAHDQPEWLRGGAVMVGGGGFRGITTPPSPALLDLPLAWWVGARDGTGRSPLWSAHGAATEGWRGFGAAGFRRLSFHEIPGVRHSQYNLPGILRTTLEKTPGKRK